jgi:tetratricopeptide (TPR) repeat protein
VSLLDETPVRRTDPLAARRMLANVRERLFRTPAAPVQVGPYQVERRLGAGSMGTVFEAYDPRLDRKLALKLVAIPDDAILRAAMLREARALARLHHPHVVAVFDAGIEDQLGWVAMQLLRGCDLLRWSAGTHDVAEVLARLREIGEGLAAVHEVGLVHRDVKPSNAFVTEDGPACLVDFGLAIDDADAWSTSRISGTWASPSRTIASRPFAIAGTPAYMAPEQHRGERAVAASDQFAWCTTAWELLYGTRPFVAATVDGLLARKLEGALPRSSLRADVRQDVHAILLRGLAADPNDRHAGMRALLDAWPGSGARRSRRGFATVAGVALAAVVVAGASTSRAAAGVCTEEASAWGPTQRAELGSAVTDRIDARLTALSDAHARARASTCELVESDAIGTATADRRLACLGQWRAELVALVDTMRAADSDALTHAWEWTAELDDPQHCLELDEVPRVRHPPPRAELTATVATLRADLLRATSDLRTRDLEAAQRGAIEVRNAAERIDFRPLVAEAALELGRIHRARGAAEEAEAALSEAYLEARAARHAYVEVHAAMGMIAVLVQDVARPADAWIWLDRARLVDARGFTGVDVGLLAYEGMIRTELEDYEGAIAPLERAVARARELGEDHPAYLSVVGNLLVGLNHVARHEEALTLARAHVDDQTRALGGDHPALASTWHHLGVAAWELGDLAAAHDAFARSLAIERRHRGPRSQAVALGLYELGVRAVFEGDAERAIAALDEALEIVDEDHRLIASLALARGDAALLVDRSEEATAWFERARVAAEGAFGVDHVFVAIAKAGTGRAALQAGRTTEARAVLESAWSAMQPTEDPSEPVIDYAVVRFALAQARWATGEQPSAVAIAHDALALVHRQPHFAMDRLARAIEDWLQPRETEVRG